ncbi:hypothetical protein [Extensimonas perlucida]|uniref:hypothetical protein n=1 Tax=Extensimonas perlucida TaxID=2590786 RepID=UPI00119F3AFF|nr:hypothetical protein [Extensimonas perlucida]
MPRAGSKTAQAARNRAMQADRCRGFSYRKIAELHGVSVALAYKVTRHVHMQFLSRWHRARQREEPMPPCTSVHALLAPH